MRGGSAAPNYDASIRLQDDWRNEWRKGAGGWNTVGGYSLPCSVDGGSSPLQAHKEMLEREEEDKSCDDIILE